MKNILTLLLILSMLLTFTACNNNDLQTTLVPTENITVENTATSTDNTEESTTSNNATVTTLEPSTTAAPTIIPTMSLPTKETTSSANSSNNTAKISFDDLVSLYSGRWYLDGYFDVYIDIFIETDSEARNDVLCISANNFAIPDSEKNDGAIYTGSNDPNGYCSGFGIIRSQYEYFNMTNYTRNHKISFKDDYIQIGSYKFIPTQGIIIARVGGINLNKTSLELYVGESETLIATIFPDCAVNKKIVWYSTDDSTATVSSDGKVTGIAATAPYSVWIMVTTEDGNYTADCKVTVKEKNESLETPPPTIEPPATEPPATEPPATEPPVTEPPTTEPPTTEPPTTEPPTTEPPTIEEPLSVRVYMGVRFYMSSSGSVRGVFVETIASGGSENYVEYYMKVYHNGNLVTEGAQKDIIVTVANGTYTAEVYVKDSNGNEASTTHSINLSGY